jgi:hypothetical protein
LIYFSNVELDDINSLIVLGAWTLLESPESLHFYGITPNLGDALTFAREERQLESSRSQGFVFLESPSFWWLA